MRQLLRFALPILVLLALAACDWEQEVLKQLGLDEVDVAVGMFNERDVQDPFRIDIVPETSDLVSDSATGAQYAEFYHAVTLPSGAVTHQKLLAMAQLVELVDDFGLADVGAFGGVFNHGVAPADFEIRLYNRDTVGDMATFLDNSAPLFSVPVDPRSSVELDLRDPGDIAGAYADYTDTAGADAQGNYHLYVGAVSSALLEATVGEAGLFGYGFFQRTTDLAPGDFANYADNIESVADLALTGSLINNSDENEVHVVISFSESGAPDHDPSAFLDPDWWVLEATLLPGQEIQIERTAAVLTPHTQELLEWAVVKLTKGRSVQSDVGAWSEGPIDITLNVTLESTIRTKINL